MGCEGAEIHLLGLGMRLGLYLQGIAFSVVIFRGVLWRSRAMADITLVTFIALVRFRDIPPFRVLVLAEGTLYMELHSGAAMSHALQRHARVFLPR